MTIRHSWRATHGFHIVRRKVGRPGAWIWLPSALVLAHLQSKKRSTSNGIPRPPTTGTLPRGHQYVDNYIKASCFPQEDIMKWIATNYHTYHLNHCIALTGSRTDLTRYVEGLYAQDGIKNASMNQRGSSKSIATLLSIRMSSILCVNVFRNIVHMQRFLTLRNLLHYFTFPNDIAHKSRAIARYLQLIITKVAHVIRISASSST